METRETPAAGASAQSPVHSAAWVLNASIENTSLATKVSFPILGQWNFPDQGEIKCAFIAESGIPEESIAYNFVYIFWCLSHV